MQGDINTGLLQTETEDDDALKLSEPDMLSQKKEKRTQQFTKSCWQLRISSK
jgi:hypothetical protein